ncbi:MAG: hypothetical protein HWN71_04900 [Desulfobacterales bacterium]|nr:hypothetical protein [Desulfobacterales bacterium]
MNEIPLVACIKREAPPTPHKVRALKQGMAGRKVTIVQGLGALYGLFELESGAGGFMTGFAFPEMLKAMVEMVVSSLFNPPEMYRISIYSLVLQTCDNWSHVSTVYLY